MSSPEAEAQSVGVMQQVEGIRKIVAAEILRDTGGGSLSEQAVSSLAAQFVEDPKVFSNADGDVVARAKRRATAYLYPVTIALPTRAGLLSLLSGDNDGTARSERLSQARAVMEVLLRQIADLGGVEPLENSGS